MPSKKVIAVLGATGAQGGGVVQAILNDSESQFTARALTRDVSSDKAKALAAKGAEVVAADVDDADSLRRAFEGAYGAYCVTFYWNHMNPEAEIAQAGKMAKAAKQAGLRHVVWSTLEDTRQWVPLDDDRMPTLMGKYKVPHFDAKGESNHFFTDADVPTTFLNTAFYWENLIHFGSGPQRMPDGSLAILMPMADKKLPSIAVGDIGKCANAVFTRGQEFIGKTIGICGDQPTGAQVAAALTRELGQSVRYVDMDAEAYRQLDFPGADDLGNMFQFKRDFNDYYCGSRSVEFTRSLCPELLSFEQWLSQNASKIPIP